MKARNCTLVMAALLLGVFPVGAVTLLQDDFGNDTVNSVDSGNPNSIGAWWSESSRLYNESSGVLTASTATNLGVATSQWTEAKLGTSVSSQLNIFSTAIKIEVRDFSQLGTGDYTDYENFRLGLVARSTNTGALNFYGSDDGLALRISNDGRTYSLGYKLNNSATDPSSTATMTPNGGSSMPSGNLGAGISITDFDLTVSATTWELVLYTSDSSTISHAGSWDLGSSDTWGNATEGTGSSALVMYAQNGRGNTTENTYSGTAQFSIGGITVSSIPEPTRAALFALAGLFVALRRKRRDNFSYSIIPAFPGH